MVYSMVAQYTMVLVHHGVWVNTLGLYCTRGYGVVMDVVCEKKPVVWPVLHPRDTLHLESQVCFYLFINLFYYCSN